MRLTSLSCKTQTLSTIQTFKQHLLPRGSRWRRICHSPTLSPPASFSSAERKERRGGQKKGDCHGRSCGCVCTRDIFVCSVCAHLHLGCRKHKTTLARYICMENSESTRRKAMWYSSSLYVSWYAVEEMETFANRAAAALLFLAFSGQ